MEYLKHFYRDYWDWVMAGAPEMKPFSRGHDLSGCITDWAYARGISMSGMLIDYRKQLSDEGLDTLNPFNDGVRQLAFSEESQTKRCYLNGARLNFVHRHKGL